MKVFVTGGSGFLGSYLIPELVQKGHIVFALARSSKSIAKIQALGGHAVQGDVTDSKGLETAMRGCDAVIHAAAMLELWGDDQTFYNINVIGTENMLCAAQSAGIKRFIHISAASVIGGGVPAYQVDETYRPPYPPDDAYSKTKLIAEQRVIAANDSTMTTLILRPPLIWGKRQPMIETIRSAVAQGQWLWVAHGRHTLSTIHIKNLCVAIIAALDYGRGGEVYFVTDDDMRSFRTFLTAWMRVEEIELSNASIPRWVALTAGRIMARMWRIFNLGGEPPITPAMVHMIGTEMSLVDRKARKELGYRNVLTIDEELQALGR